MTSDESEKLLIISLAMMAEARELVREAREIARLAHEAVQLMQDQQAIAALASELNGDARSDEMIH
jgi:hypothetical protein